MGAKEASARRFMRAAVVTMFVVVGPLMLVLVGAQLVPDIQIGTMLDIFKIWLGAIIGISTNLLQKTAA